MIERPKADCRVPSASPARWRAAAALLVGIALLFNAIVGAGHVAARTPAVIDAQSSLAADLRILCSGGSTDPSDNNRQDRSPLTFCQICQVFGLSALPAAGGALLLPGRVVSAPSIIVHVFALADRQHAAPRNRGPPAV